MELPSSREFLFMLRLINAQAMPSGKWEWILRNPTGQATEEPDMEESNGVPQQFIPELPFNTRLIFGYFIHCPSTTPGVKPPTTSENSVRYIIKIIVFSDHKNIICVTVRGYGKTVQITAK